MVNIGICGYGNLGKAVEKLSTLNKNLNLVAIFSRRQTTASVPVLPIACAPQYKDKIDIMIMCGGSDRDLAEQSPLFAQNFNIIDTFDTHARISEHKNTVDSACKANGTCAIVSCGWDPGIFSIFRTIFSQIFDATTCFWGKGISLGHTNAIKQIDGVKNAKQFTIPLKKAKKHAFLGKSINFPLHKRVCYVTSNSHNKRQNSQIEKAIKSLPNYFLGQPTKVKFVSEKTLLKKYSSFAHCGEIISTSNTLNKKFSAHFILKMQSNPLFTAKIILAYVPALLNLKQNNKAGAFTPLEIPPCYLTSDPISSAITKFC